MHLALNKTTLLALLAATCSTGAYSAAPAPWTVIISPYVWAATLDGKTSAANFHSNVNVPFSETVKHLDLALMGQIEVNNGQFGAFLDGQYIKTSQKEHVLSNELALSIRNQSIAVGAFYRAITYDMGTDNDGFARTTMIEPMMGLRWNTLEINVTALGMRTTKKANWVDPFIGVRTNTDLSKNWGLVTEADIGGFGIGSTFSANAQAYLGYRTTLLGQATTFRIGYRAFYQDYEGNDFTGHTFRWNTTQHGPVIGMSMQF